MDRHSFYVNVGSILRVRRKAEGLTLDALAKKINKSTATLSKYEKGEIAIAMDVLADLCSVLNVDLCMLLSHAEDKSRSSGTNRCLERRWIYWYKHSERNLHTAVLEYNTKTRNAVLFRNVRDVNNFYDCGYIYHGNIFISDHNIDCVVQNTAPPREYIKIGIPTLSTEREFKTGLIVSINENYQNVAIKCLCSKTLMQDKAFLTERLQISMTEMKSIRDTNFFGVW